MGKTYWLETYGCQMNKAESTGFDIGLSEAGWNPASSPDKADLVLLNTCSVRTTAENRIWGRIGFYKALKKSRDFQLAVVGCMAERLKVSIQEREPAVDYVVGTFDKESFFNRLHGGEQPDDPRAEVEGQRKFIFSDIYNDETNFQALVPIMHGCDNFCAYCIVPHVRGRETSRDPNAIRGELNLLRDRGVQEVTLLGQNVNSYSYGTGSQTVSFPRLLESIVLDFPEIPWIRFLTSHPRDFTSDLIDVIGKYRRICNHVHLPVQHGSDNILKRMNRKYTREQYLSLVFAVRDKIPDVTLSTDILVGFPGETEDDFFETCRLMEEVRFHDAFTYYFNPIEGTAAAEMEETVSQEVKLKRLSKIIELQHNIAEQVHREKVGSVIQVLAEGISKKNKEEILARTEHNHMVVFPGSEQVIGSFTTVKLIEYSGNTYRGEEVL